MKNKGTHMIMGRGETTISRVTNDDLPGFQGLHFEKAKDPRPDLVGKKVPEDSLDHRPIDEPFHTQEGSFTLWIDDFGSVEILIGWINEVLDALMEEACEEEEEE